MGRPGAPAAVALRVSIETKAAWDPPTTPRGRGSVQGGGRAVQLRLGPALGSGPGRRSWAPCLRRGRRMAGSCPHPRGGLFGAAPVRSQLGCSGTRSTGFFSEESICRLSSNNCGRWIAFL